MIIYRFECSKCGNGPYTCNCEHWQDGQQELKDKHNTDYFLRKCPGMMVDLPNFALGFEQWYCGFNSMKQLEKWFTEEDREVFTQHGFTVIRYESQDFVVGRSGSQVFFLREEADALL